jgi:hypothetical protein
MPSKRIFVFLRGSSCDIHLEKSAPALIESRAPPNRGFISTNFIFSLSVKKSWRVMTPGPAPSLSAGLAPCFMIVVFFTIRALVTSPFLSSITSVAKNEAFTLGCPAALLKQSGGETRLPIQVTKNLPYSRPSIFIFRSALSFELFNSNHKEQDSHI